VIYGLVAALGWGSTDFLGAISGRRMGSLPALAVSQLAGTCVAVVLFVVHGEGLSPVDGLLGFVVANGLIAMTAYALHYRALELGPVAVVSPIGAGYAVVGFSLAVLLLDEHPGPTAVVGGVVTIAGVVLVSTNLPALVARLHTKPPGLWWAVGSSIGFGLAGLLLGVIARDSGDWIVTLLATRVALIVALAPLVYVRRRTFHRLGDAGTKAYATAAIAGLFDLMGVAAYSAGATRGYLSVVLAASAIFPMIAVALSVAFLRERLALNQYLGVIAVVGGLLLLALVPGS
jgi:uncharacterized membrane protein